MNSTSEEETMAKPAPQLQVPPEVVAEMVRGEYALRQMRLAEIQRQQRSPFRPVARAAYGLWRSIITGGWE